MVAGGSDILRTPRPGEHKRRTIYERRISRCYARSRLPPTIAKPARVRPPVARPGRNHMNAALYPKEGLEVGGGADAEAGGFLVEEAGRSQILRGQAE
jgi:hypothetical protein